MLKRMLERIKNNPARVVGAVEALIAFLVVFGVHLTHEQIDAVWKLLAAIWMLVAVGTGEVVRSQVTPNRQVDAKVAAGIAASCPPPAAPVDSDRIETPVIPAPPKEPTL